VHQTDSVTNIHQIGQIIDTNNITAMYRALQ